MAFAAKMRKLEHGIADLQSLKDTMMSTANTVRKNGVSFKSAGAIYRGGKRAAKQIGHIRSDMHGRKRGGGGRGRRRPVAVVRGRGIPPRRRPNAVEQGTRVTKRELNRDIHSRNYQFRKGKNIGLIQTGMPVNRRNSSRAGTEMEHSELITPVYATGNEWMPQFIPVAPSIPRLNPFAANLSRQYQKTKVHAIIITYTGTCGTSTDGRIWMGFDTRTNTFQENDYNDASGFSSLDNKPPEGGCPLWGSCMFHVDVRSFSKGPDGVLTNFNGDLSSIKSDLEQYIGGYFCFVTDSSATGNVGNLMVTYRYTFEYAKLPSPPSDFYTYSNDIGVVFDSDTAQDILNVVNQVSDSPVTSIQFLDTIASHIIVFPSYTNVIVSYRVSGTGFTAFDGDPTSATLYQLDASQGSSCEFYTGLGNTTDQIVQYSCEMIDNGYLLLTATTTGAADIEMTDFQLFITLSEVDISDSTNLALLSSKKRKPSHYVFSARDISHFLTDFKRTGEKPNLLATRGKKKQFSDLSHLFAALPEPAVDDVKDDKSPTTVKIVKDWMVTNKGMHAVNGNGLWVLILLIVFVQSQMIPTFPSSLRPTRNPVTPFPTTARRPQNNTNNYNRYSMIVIQGDLATPLASYLETSPKPIVYKHNSTTLRYSGIFSSPVNITVAFTLTSVFNGYYSFKSAGAPTKVIGRACVSGSRQTALFFWMIRDIHDLYLTFIPAADASDIEGLLYLAPVNNIPANFVIPISGPTLHPTTAAPTTMIRL
jgi:hypothetical protein